jgi:hypothetical protein
MIYCTIGVEPGAYSVTDIRSRTELGEKFLYVLEVLVSKGQGDSLT